MNSMKRKKLHYIKKFEASKSFDVKSLEFSVKRIEKK
jgi:hypothetical protein